MGIVLSLPVLSVIAVCIKLTSPGPVFFQQKRVGKHQVPFTIYKFRTMRAYTEGLGPSVTSEHDVRMTRFGSLLRRFKLDELPQLFNVIRGDMSLVGPRPKLQQHERMKMTCRPGITGAATLVFAHEETLLTQLPEDAVEDFTINVLNHIKAQLDTEYASRSTFRSDFGIIVCTLGGSNSHKPYKSLPDLMKTFGGAPLPRPDLMKTFGTSLPQ